VKLGIEDIRVLVRGAGDLATGVIAKLHESGFRVVAVEIPQPTVIRRTVAFAQAVFDGETTVEGIRALRTEWVDVESVWARGAVPVVVDPRLEGLNRMRFDVVVDAIIAKRNLGTTIDMAPIVIGLGPGFEAGKDVHAVIETMRGHYLGRGFKVADVDPRAEQDHCLTISDKARSIGGGVLEAVLHLARAI